MYVYMYMYLYLCFSFSQALNNDVCFYFARLRVVLKFNTLYGNDNANITAVNL